MSNTRRTTTPGTFKQERFASSQEFERGLMANLVAKRCSVLERAEDRELIWALQLLSHRLAGLKNLAGDLMALFPERIATDSMRKFGTKAGQIYSAEKVRVVREEVAGHFPLKGESDLERAGMGFFLLDENKEMEARLKNESRFHPANYPAAKFVECCHEAALCNLGKHLQTLCLDPALPVADGSAWYFPAMRFHVAGIAGQPD